MDINFTEFSKGCIIFPEKAHTPKHDFSHAVLDIQWELSRKLEIARVFDATHLAESLSYFSLESAAIHDQFPELKRQLLIATARTDIRKVAFRARTVRQK